MRRDKAAKGMDRRDAQDPGPRYSANGKIVCGLRSGFILWGWALPPSRLSIYVYGGNCKLQAEEGKGWACIVHGARKVLQSTWLKPGKGNTTLFSSSPGVTSFLIANLCHNLLRSAAYSPDDLIPFFGFK